MLKLIFLWLRKASTSDPPRSHFFHMVGSDLTSRRELGSAALLDTRLRTDLVKAKRSAIAG